MSRNIWTCGVWRPGRSIADRIFTVQKIFGVDGRLLLTVKSLYSCSDVCVRVGGVETQKPEEFICHYTASQQYALVILTPLCKRLTPPSLKTRGVDSHSRVDEGVRSCKIKLLPFADDLELLASSEQGFQYALDRFWTVCDQAGMKISTTKTEVLCLSRKSNQCALQVSGNTAIGMGIGRGYAPPGFWNFQQKRLFFQFWVGKNKFHQCCFGPPWKNFGKIP